MSTLEEVRDIFIYLQDIEVDEDTILEKDLDLDSLSTFELLREIEFRFDIEELSVDNYLELVTIKDLVNLIDAAKN